MELQIPSNPQTVSKIKIRTLFRPLRPQPRPLPLPLIVKVEDESCDDDNGYRSYRTTPSTEAADNNSEDVVCSGTDEGSGNRNGNAKTADGETEPRAKLLMEKIEINGEVYEINYPESANLTNNGTTVAVPVTNSDDLVKDLKELKMEIAKMKNLNDNNSLKVKTEDNIDDEFEATDYQIPPLEELDISDDISTTFDEPSASQEDNERCPSSSIDAYTESIPSTSVNLIPPKSSTAVQSNNNSQAFNSELTIKTEDSSSVDSELSSPTTSDMSSSNLDVDPVNVKEEGEENANSSTVGYADLDDFEMIQAFCEPILDENDIMVPDIRIKEEFDDVLDFINGNSGTENGDVAMDDGAPKPTRRPRYSDILPLDPNNPSDMALIAPETTGLTCKLCNTRFTQSSSLIRHMRTHTGGKPYQCNKCVQRYEFKWDLIKHLREHKQNRIPMSNTVQKIVKELPEITLKSSKLKAKDAMPTCGCGKTFSTKENLRQHIVTIHMNIKNHKCPVCGKKYPYPSRLMNHMQKHTDLEIQQSSGEKPFACDVCDERFATKYFLTKHLEVHTGVKQAFQCSECNKTFDDVSNYRRHKTLHENREMFACWECDRAFPMRDYLDNHMETVHGVKKHVCPTCSESFSSKTLLTAHFKTHIVEIEKLIFPCELCPEKYTSKYFLTKHLEKSHAGDARLLPDITKVCTCQTCGRSFPNRHSLANHMRSHTEGELNFYSFRTTREAPKVDDKRFECDVCHKKFSEKTHLGLHMAVHKRNPFHCGVCRERFPTQDALDEHSKSHQDQQKPCFRCEICYQKFDTDDKLKQHAAKHESEPKEFNCPDCGKEFGRKLNLDRHYRTIHLKIKNHVCFICQKAFAKSWDLNLHMRTHTGERPYQCPKCTQRFTQKGTMKKHIETQHENN